MTGTSAFERSTLMMKTNMTETQLIEAFEAQGYKPYKVKTWKSSGETYVYIRDRQNLIAASEFGRTLGVTVATPC